MKNSTVLLFTERKFSDAFLPVKKKKKSVGGGIVTMRGQGECNGHSIIMLVGCVN